MCPRIAQIFHTKAPMSSSPSYEGPSKHELIALVNRYNDYHRGNLLSLSNVSDNDYRLAEQIRSNQRRARANYSPIQVLAKELVNKLEQTFHLNDYSIKQPDQAKMGAFQGKLADLKKFMRDFNELKEQGCRDNRRNEGSRRKGRGDGHKTPAGTPPRATKATPASTNNHKTEGTRENGLLRKSKEVAKGWDFDLYYQKLKEKKERREDEDRVIRDAEFELAALEVDRKKRQAREKADEDERIKREKAYSQANQAADKRNTLSKENITNLENTQAGTTYFYKDTEKPVTLLRKEQVLPTAFAPKDPPQGRRSPQADTENSAFYLKTDSRIFRPERAPSGCQPETSLPKCSVHPNISDLKAQERARRPSALPNYAGTAAEDLAKRRKYEAQALKEAEKTKEDQIKRGETRDEEYERKVLEARVKGLAMQSEVRRLD